MGDVARVQVIIPYRSGVPSDVITNTWHFESLSDESITSAKLATLFNHLVTFYNTCYVASAIKSMASWVNPSLVVMKGYNLSDAKPRTAVRESVTPLTVGTQASDATPAELSMVLSYHTEYESGIPKASQRGRIYLGALSALWIDNGSISGSATFKQATRENVTGAADTLAASALSSNWGWTVWSEKRQEKFAVAGGWVDNAFDTQRRRGQAATTRTTFST